MEREPRSPRRETVRAILVVLIEIWISTLDLPWWALPSAIIVGVVYLVWTWARGWKGKVGALASGAVGFLSLVLWAFLPATQMVDILPLPITPEAAMSETFAVMDPTAEETARIERDARVSLVGNLITLAERDPGSWPPHVDGEGEIRLDEPITLSTHVSRHQRFNPQLMVPQDADDVLDAVVFLYLPRRPFTAKDAITIEAPDPWNVTESDNPNLICYYAHFGSVNRGLISAPVNEAFFLTAQSSGVFKVRYTIMGRTASTHGVFPIRRAFVLDIRP